MKLYELINILITTFKKIICDFEQFIFQSLSTNGIYEPLAFWDYSVGVIFLSIIIALWVLILPVLPFMVACLAVAELKHILLKYTKGEMK